MGWPQVQCTGVRDDEDRPACRGRGGRPCRPDRDLADRLRAVETTEAAAHDLLETCRAHRRLGVAHPGLYSFMFERAIPLDPKSTSNAVAESFDQLMQRISRLVSADDGASTGHAHAYGLWALCHGLVNLETTGMGTSKQVADNDATIDTAISTFVDGLVAAADRGAQ